METELMDALCRVIELQAERNTAFKDCDSSWGYYGQEVEERLSKAKRQAEDELRKIIRQEIKNAVRAKP